MVKLTEINTQGRFWTSGFENNKKSNKIPEEKSAATVCILCIYRTGFEEKLSFEIA